MAATKSSATGALQLVPIGESLTALERDYAAMLEDGLLALNQPGFADIMKNCHAIEAGRIGNSTT